MMKIPCLVASVLFSAAVAPALAAETVEGFVPGADQVRIHYRQAGPSDARHTLLFLPGWRVSSSIWSKQLGHFASRQYRVIAIDSRSQGGSSVVQSGNAPEDRAADIQQVVSQLHLTNLILVGWSQGAQDVAAYVERFGTAALDGLALIDSPVSAGPDEAADSPGFVKVILEGIAAYSRDPRAYSDGMMRAIFTAPVPPQVLTQLVDESMKTPPDIGISMLIQDLFTTDRRPALKKFDKPTLVVASGESRLLDAQRRMAAALPRAQLVVIAKSAHAVFFDQPDEFNQRLEDFVSSVEAAEGEHSAKPQV